MWSIREEVLHVTHAEQGINYLDIYLSRNYLKYNFRICKRLMLKSPRRHISLSFRFNTEKLLTINSMKLAWFGGL